MENLNEKDRTKLKNLLIDLKGKFLRLNKSDSSEVQEINRMIDKINATLYNFDEAKKELNEVKSLYFYEKEEVIPTMKCYGSNIDLNNIPKVMNVEFSRPLNLDLKEIPERNDTIPKYIIDETLNKRITEFMTIVQDNYE